MHLHIHITANEPGEAILAELMANAEIREMLVERLEEHLPAALYDAVFDLLPHREGIDDCEFEVSIDNDTLPVLVLAAVEQGKGDALGPLPIQSKQPSNKC